MADRYWVGGAGAWSNVSTANWSTATGLSFTASCTGTALTTTGSPALVVGMTVWSSTHVSLGTIVSGAVNTWVVSVGGTYASQNMSAATIGASVPTAADSVFFDANSNSGTTSFTVTMSVTPRVCNDFTASGLDGTMTLAGTAIGLTVSGSLTFQATRFTRTYTGTTTFNATTTGKTVTTNGVAFGGPVTFNGVGGDWTLGSALNLGLFTLTLTNGTFDTSALSNYSVTADLLLASTTSVRTINLNASTITCSNYNPIQLNVTNLTFNAGTSQINCTNSSVEFTSSGKTVYNVSFTSTALNTPILRDAITFNNLSITGRTTVGIGVLSLSANQTINGTFEVSAGTAAAYRIAIVSDTVGTARTLTCASIAAMTDVDFRDITIAGTHGTLSGTRLGDCKGNSNITFPAAKTVYYGQTGNANWGATGSGSWSATSGGALDATMCPLAQDTAVFPAATYPASGSTTTFNVGYNIGTIDMSLRTSNTMTLDLLASRSIFIYKNWLNGTGITLSNGNPATFAGRTTQTITSASKAFSQGITINSPSGSVTLQDALTMYSTRAATLTNGTLDLNGFTLTVGTAFTTATGTKNLTFNGGTLVCPAASAFAFNNNDPTNFTTTAGTGVGTISMTGATAKTFVGAGSTFNCTLNQGGAGALTITGSNTFSNITNTVQPASILFTAGTTSTFTSFSLSGTAGNLITIDSVTAASHTLSKASGTVSSDFLSISRSTATGGAGWYAEANSTDGGNNAGWIFTAPPAPSGSNSNFLMFF